MDEMGSGSGGDFDVGSSSDIGESFDSDSGFESLETDDVGFADLSGEIEALDSDIEFLGDSEGLVCDSVDDGVEDLGDYDLPDDLAVASGEVEEGLDMGAFEDIESADDISEEIELLDEMDALPLDVPSNGEGQNMDVPADVPDIEMEDIEMLDAPDAADLPAEDVLTEFNDIEQDELHQTDDIETLDALEVPELNDTPDALPLDGVDLENGQEPGEDIAVGEEYEEEDANSQGEHELEITPSAEVEELTESEADDTTPLEQVEMPPETEEAVDADNELPEEIEAPEMEEQQEESLEAVEENLLEVPEEYEEESQMTLTREITPEILESRERDTEEVLDNYRENLRGYGVDEEKIEEFVNGEREKINAEYEALDRGDTSAMYETPNDWSEVAASLSEQEIQGEQTEALSAETNELDINYDEIYSGIEQEALAEGFQDVQIDADAERLDSTLEPFDESAWQDLQLDEQKQSMEDLAGYVTDVIGFENPPQIEYYNNERRGDYGGYDPATNTLSVNEYMLYDSKEAADTIAHELWHAHQYERARNPESARDYQYQYNFENYVSPDLGQEAYESQLVEAEARAFAEQFKDRLSQIRGRSR